ncbi:alpha-galactosidase [Lentzea sp. BCCO 10_0856]|uniref:Alpha-galactosidase n=1 Tax=Lentzea miocenica TaxID=3095431 RepID=A0ABU4TBL1_9PSEU|nr:alpha-galactosidase [Lentzea sp. BCCO 10_0856]MDX8035567.1 alpha-galactosidase [Lentzea sp. BCCO 10_0856]
MNNTEVVHLHDDTSSVVITLQGAGLPVMTHWGRTLGNVDQAALHGLVDVVSWSNPNNAPDAPVPLALLPDAGAGYVGRPGLRGHRGGEHFAPSLAVTSFSGEDGAIFRYVASDEAAELTVTGTLELLASGMVRLRHVIRNDGTTPYALEGLETALPVPSHATELLDFTGRWSRERAPQRQTFNHGSWVRENRRGRTGHDATIGLLAGTPGFSFRDGEVWALHVAWSGNHVTYAENLVDGSPVLGGGELLLPGEITLAPGEQYESPWIYAAYSPAGIDGIGAAFHRQLRERELRPRPVVLNTWEAVYFDHDLARLTSLADTAAAIGVERFVLDDGWFRHRRDDSAGLGDWYVDETVWPDGLTPLIKHVRALGMEFGLWFEPEMINTDSDLYRAHPDWVLGPRPGVLPPPSRNQQVLNIAHPEAYAYILDRVSSVLSDNDIAFVKWDHNRDLIGSRVHDQTAAYYRLLDELRLRHPHVEIESCSSGGGRIDLGVLSRTDRVWTSDCNDALERQLIQRWTGVFLPPELMGAHVGPTKSHTTGRVHDLSFRVATAVFGHFGIEWDINSATDEERAGLQAAIEYYKDVRSLVQTGVTVHSDHPDAAAWVHGIVAADQSEALFGYVQLATSVQNKPRRVRLPGLDPARTYRLSFDAPAGRPKQIQRLPADWKSVELPGSVLSEAGIQLPVLEPEQALLLRLK